MVECVVQKFQSDLTGEVGGGQQERKGLGNVVTVGDNGEKPLNCPVGSCGNSSEEGGNVADPPPHLKPSRVSPGSSRGNLLMPESPSEVPLH